MPSQPVLHEAPRIAPERIAVARWIASYYRSSTWDASRASPAARRGEAGRPGGGAGSPFTMMARVGAALGDARARTYLEKRDGVRPMHLLLKRMEGGERALHDLVQNGVLELNAR